MIQPPAVPKAMRPDPVCDWPDCTHLATVFLGHHGFDGAGTSFIRTKALCDEHMKEYMRADPNAGSIEYIK